MIDIRDLTDEDLGRWVVYIDGSGGRQEGRIKSWNDMWIFVVYNCADEWDKYQDYTGCATGSSDLQFMVAKPGENDINDRFEILDL
jgi:hypothetical protein